MNDTLATADHDADDRLIRESGVEARVAAIVLPLLVGLGYRLVRVRTSGQNGLTLQIMAERPDGTMTVEDCEEVSRLLSPALDVEDPIGKAYHLEISSPGIDRPLVRRTDFSTWAGHQVRLETSVLVDGRKRFKGRIAEAGEAGVMIENTEPSYGAEPKVVVPYEAIAEARLVLTDDLIRDALSQDNKARKEAKKRRRHDDAADEIETQAETQAGTQD